MKKYIFPLLALTLSACVEDEGNYTYRTLNDITIEDDTDVIQALAYIDEIEITPTITGTIDGEDLSNYDFHWYLCYNNHTHITLGNEKDLKWKADMQPGIYSIYLSVTDKVTKLEKNYYRTVSLSSPFTTGFLILGEDMSTGQGALDMLTMPSGRDTTMVENVFEDVSMLTAPEKIIFTGPSSSPSAKGRQQNLWISANGTDFEITSGGTFEFTRSFEKAGIVEIPTVPHITPMRLVDVFPHQGSYGRNRSTSWRGYLTEDMMFGGATFTSDYHTQPINKYTANSKTFFKPAPYIWYNYAYIRPSVFIGYDMDSECFVKLPGSYQYICTALTDVGAVSWQWNLRAEGRTLVYGDNDPSGSYGMCNALVKDKNGDNYYIYRFQAPTSTYGVATKQPLYVIDRSLTPDLENAEHIMFSGIKTAMLYSVGNRLYQYDYARGKADYIDLDAPITYLSGEFASQGSKDEIVVATYSEQSKGMICKYEVGQDPNTIEFNLREDCIWPTRLKVKDIEWKDAN